MSDEQTCVCGQSFLRSKVNAIVRRRHAVAARCLNCNSNLVLIPDGLYPDATLTAPTRDLRLLRRVLEQEAEATGNTLRVGWGAFTHGPPETP